MIARDTGRARTAPAVVLHWKDGRTWRRGSFVADEGQTLGDVLRGFAGYVDQHGLEQLLEKAAGR